MTELNLGYKLMISFLSIVFKKVKAKNVHYYFRKYLKSDSSLYCIISLPACSMLIIEMQ